MKQWLRHQVKQWMWNAGWSLRSECEQADASATKKIEDAWRAVEEASQRIKGLESVNVLMHEEVVRLERERDAAKWNYNTTDKINLKLQKDVKRLKREINGILCAAEAAGMNRDLYQGKYEQLRKVKVNKAPARKKAA